MAFTLMAAGIPLSEVKAMDMASFGLAYETAKRSEASTALNQAHVFRAAQADQKGWREWSQSMMKAAGEKAKTLGPEAFKSAVSGMVRKKR